MGILFALICAVCYSSNYIFIQLGMKKSEKDNGNFASLFAAVITVLIIYLGMLLFVDREPIPFSGRGVFFYLTAGFFTAFLGRVLLNAGIRKIGSSRAAAIKNAAPLFTILIAVSLIGERITYGAALGMVVILAALAFQAKHDFSRSEMLDGRNKYWGFFLALASAAAFGIGQASRKEGVIHYADPVFGSLIGSAFALIVFVIMELVQKRFHETVTNNFRRINVHFILAGVLTGIAQVSFFLSLTFTHVSYTSVVAAVEPIITVILGSLFLKKEENIGLRIILTACAVCIGTVMLVVGK